MSAALKLPIANDNLPAVPVPSERVMEAPPVVRIANRGEGLIVYLAAWSLVLGAVFGLFPGKLAFVPSVGVLVAASATMLALHWRSRVALWAGTALFGAMCALLLVGQTNVFSGMVWPVLLGALWVGLVGAASLRSDTVAAIALGVIGVAAVAAMGEDVLGSRGGAATAAFGVGFAYLGTARFAAHKALATADAHYVTAWLAVCVAAVAVMHPAVPVILDAEGYVVVGCLGLAGVVIWAMQGGFAAVQGVAVFTLGALAVVPGLEARAVELSQMGWAGQPFGYILGMGAAMAAGAALAFRGARRGQISTAVIGAVAVFVTLLVAINPSFMTLDTVMLLAVAGSVMTAWLLAARLA